MNMIYCKYREMAYLGSDDETHDKRMKNRKRRHMSAKIGIYDALDDNVDEVSVAEVFDQGI